MPLRRRFSSAINGMLPAVRLAVGLVIAVMLVHAAGAHAGAPGGAHAPRVAATPAPSGDPAVDPATITAVAFPPLAPAPADPPGADRARPPLRVAFGHRDGTVSIHDVEGWARIARFKAEPTAVGALAFSPDGSLLATAASGVHLWETTGWTARAEPQGASAPVAFARGGGELVTGSARGQGLRFYRLGPDGRCRFTGASPGVGNVRALSADATVAIAAKGEWEVRIWRIPPKGALVPGATLKNAGWWGGISGVAISADGSRFATMGSTQEKPPQGEATLWESVRGKQVGFRSLGYFTTAGAFTADGGLFALAGSFEQSAQLGVTDCSTGKPIWSQGSGFEPPMMLPEIRVAAFTPDGTALLTVGGSCLRLWDARTGALRSAIGTR